MAVDSNLGTVVGEEEGAVASIPGNEGRITQAWVNVRGGMRVFFGVLLALRRLDLEEQSPAGGSCEANKNNQTPVVNSV